MRRKQLEIIDYAIEQCNRLHELGDLHENFVEFVKNQEDCRCAWNNCENVKIDLQERFEVIESKLVVRDNRVKQLETENCKMKTLVASLEEKNKKLNFQLNEINKLLNDSNMPDDLRKYLKYTEINENKVSNCEKFTIKYNSPVPLTEELTSSDEEICYMTPNREKSYMTTKDARYETHQNHVAIPDNYNRSYHIVDEDVNLVKRHYFTAYTGLENTVTCKGCNHTIKPKAKCYICDYCCQVVHEECIVKLPNDCSLSELYLEDFVEGRVPSIPVLIKKCIKEVNKRGLNEYCVYLKQGDEFRTKELLQSYLITRDFKFKRNEDITVIASTLKLFLSRLCKPLIPDKLKNDFFSCSANYDFVSMKRLIMALPTPQLHTLSALMIHFRALLESKNTCVDMKSISKTFSYILISCDSVRSDSETFKKVCEIRKLFQELISLESDFYKKILDDAVSEYRLNKCRLGLDFTPTKKTKQQIFSDPYPAVDSPLNIGSPLVRNKNLQQKKTRFNFFGKTFGVPR